MDSALGIFLFPLRAAAANELGALVTAVDILAAEVLAPEMEVLAMRCLAALAEVRLLRGLARFGTAPLLNSTRHATAFLPDRMVGFGTSALATAVHDLDVAEAVGGGLPVPPAPFGEAMFWFSKHERAGHSTAQDSTLTLSLNFCRLLIILLSNYTNLALTVTVLVFTFVRVIL